MTIEMTDKWVTSFRFNERKNVQKCLIGFLIDFIFCRLAKTTVLGSPSVTWLSGSDISLGSQCSYHLRFFSKLCMRVVDKKVNYAGLLCCHEVNNSQTTPGITMHELPCATDPQWGESGLNLYNSNELTFLLRHITPICVASTSVSAISQTP